MNLTQAEQFRQDQRAAGATSDGCTFAPELGTPCCEMHDYLRRLQPTDPNTGRPLTPAAADRLLRECLINKGHFFLGWTYWIAVRAGAFLGLYR
jgi:hypothetical protein